jgi:membrane protease YdiL (CAAX protease family)
MFNVAYTLVTNPVKMLAINCLDYYYPSTSHPFDSIANEIEKSNFNRKIHLIGNAVLLICVAAPIGEELIFRGAIQFGATWITGSKQCGIVTATALFALSHYLNCNNPLDVVFTYADCHFLINPARASGGILGGIAAHSLHNLVCFAPYIMYELMRKEQVPQAPKVT